MSRWGKCVVAMLVLAGVGTDMTWAQPRQLPVSTTLPVVFTRSIDASTAQPGMRVIAKTRQVILLPDGQSVPAGSILVGHVVQSAPLAPAKAPYAVAAPSTLSIHFDVLRETRAAVPVSLTVRAIAGPITSHEAEIPHFRDETDTAGTHVLIGGDTFASLETTVLSPSGDVVGFVRKQGVFARLQAGENDERDYRVKCGASMNEQSVDIFSPDACGVYGLKTVSLHDASSHAEGTFVLESRGRTVKLNAGSTALLQVVPPLN